MTTPLYLDFGAIQQIICHLLSTSEHRLLFLAESSLNFTAYNDSDWADPRILVVQRQDDVYFLKMLYYLRNVRSNNGCSHLLRKQNIELCLLLVMKFFSVNDSYLSLFFINCNGSFSC